MGKRLERFRNGELQQLRSMLEHSQKEYMQLHTMLNGYLTFSQEEMRKSLGFVPRVVVQVAAVCANASPDPLDNFDHGEIASSCVAVAEN